MQDVNAIKKSQEPMSFVNKIFDYQFLNHQNNGITSLKIPENYRFLVKIDKLQNNLSGETEFF